MSVRVYRSFQEMPGDVRQHFSYPTQPNFFLSFDWFFLLFETSLSQTVTPHIYVVSDERGTPVGALFCCVAQQGLVRRLLSLTNFYTMGFSLCLTQGGTDMRAVVRELVSYIAAERPRWHLVLWKLMRTDTAIVRYVSEQLSESGFSSYQFFQYENWYFEAGGSNFQTYFSERPPSLRKNIIRREKNLGKMHPFEIKVVGHNSDRLEEMARDFIAVYNRSWRQAEPFPNFIPMLTTVCARLGILRLGILYVEGKPAAGQLWITSERKAIIYKVAYDEQFRNLGVGAILSKEMFRIALDEDHVEEIDYGVGSEPYKKDWMSSVRKIEGIEAFNRKTLVGLFLSSKEALKAARRSFPFKSAKVS